MCTCVHVCVRAPARVPSRVCLPVVLGIAAVKVGQLYQDTSLKINKLSS